MKITELRGQEYKVKANIIKVENYNELSRKAADILLKEIKQNKKVNLGLATGSTPIGLYQLLIKDFRENKTSYDHVNTFNLDEYIGLDANHPTSYHTYMYEELFNHIPVPIDQIFIPNGTTSDVHQFCEDYEEKIDELGGIDVQILGIGVNGHIAFNEPHTPFDSKTSFVKLTEETRKSNARFFDSIQDVPTHAISMGLQSIMKAKKIILLISGDNKKEAYRNIRKGIINTSFPASVLHNHPNVTIIVDKEAYS